ncbi:MFS transporter [Streptomyces sp. NPDC012751]|uniref:MFS transporter n=1 Tax=Streptomyces sp. NPDC012751 TaxID=3364846 RepID=UPI0036A9862B
MKLPNSAITRLLLVHLLLYGGMSLSKTAWPLYLDQQNALQLVAVTYTTMAITGIVGAALTGWLIDRIGIPNVLLVGSAVYAVGLLLRLQHTSWALAILNGFVMGVGASALTTCLRPWMVQVTDVDTRPLVVSYRTATLNIGTALGAAFLSPLLLLSPSSQDGYVAGLILPAIAIGAIALMRPRRIDRIGAQNTSPPVKIPIPWTMAIGVIFLGLLSGFGLSMLGPYVPLILSRNQVPTTVVGVIVGLLAVVRVLVSLCIGAVDSRRRRLTGLTAAQLVIVTACLGAVAWTSPIAVTALLALIYGSLAVSAYCEELLQSDLFPERSRGRLFGLSSSGFLAGDALGGMTGGLILTKTSVTGLLLTYACAATAIAIAYPVFVRRMRRIAGDDMTHDDVDPINGAAT